MAIPLILLFGISGGEILMLILLVLLLFGPKKIPEIARMLGKGLGEVRKVQREINSEIHRYSSEVEGEAKKMETEVKKEVEAFKNTASSTPEDNKENSDNIHQTEETNQGVEELSDDDLPLPYKQAEESKHKAE